MASSSYDADYSVRCRHTYSHTTDIKSVSKGSKVQAKDSTIPFEVTFASGAPVAKKAKLDEPEEELGCFLAVPIIDWPSAPRYDDIFGFATFRC